MIGIVYIWNPKTNEAIGFVPPQPLPKQAAFTCNGDLYYLNEFNRLVVLHGVVARWVWDHLREQEKKT